jgi:tetratricopeptide (TPR) repeat protein
MKSYWCMAWLIVAVSPFMVEAAARKPEQDVQVVDRFLAAIQNNAEFSEVAREKAANATEGLKKEEDGLPMAITQGLSELYPAFRSALNALGEENLVQATSHLQELIESKDPYLAAEANYFLARIHLLEERYEKSLPLLDALEMKYAESSIRGGEALFLKGVALGQMLKREEATKTLERYLENYPNSPERMKIGAWRQLEQLKMIQDGTLSDAQFRMDFSRRRLALEDSSTELQTEQKKIVSILETLIKEAEEKECNCKGSGKGQGKKQGKAGESEGQGKPESDGKQGGNTGGGSKGTDSDAVERLHRGGPQSPWSKLRDKDRDPVFNAIKEKFPGRYQQLIEQYYKSFEEDAEG